MPSPLGMANLDGARAAYYYTLNKLPIGHTNVAEDAIANPVRELEALNRLFPMRWEADDTEKERFVNEDDRFRHAQIVAEKAEKYQMGNCEEQSAVAFMFLYRMNKFTIDWTRLKRGKHAFVIIGRLGGGIYKPEDVEGAFWYPDAVICDPQDKRWGYWSDLVEYYPIDNMLPMLHSYPGKLMTWKNL